MRLPHWTPRAGKSWRTSRRCYEAWVGNSSSRDVRRSPTKRAIKIGPFGSQLKKCDLVRSGIRVVGIENVLSETFDGLGGRFISPEKFQTWICSRTLVLGCRLQLARSGC